MLRLRPRFIPRAAIRLKTLQECFKNAPVTLTVKLQRARRQKRREMVEIYASLLKFHAEMRADDIYALPNDFEYRKRNIVDSNGRILMHVSQLSQERVRAISGDPHTCVVVLRFQCQACASDEEGVDDTSMIELSRKNRVAEHLSEYHPEIVVRNNSAPTQFVCQLCNSEVTLNSHALLVDHLLDKHGNGDVLEKASRSRNPDKDAKDAVERYRQLARPREQLPCTHPPSEWYAAPDTSAAAAASCLSSSATDSDQPRLLLSSSASSSRSSSTSVPSCYSGVSSLPLFKNLELAGADVSESGSGDDLDAQTHVHSSSTLPLQVVPEIPSRPGSHQESMEDWTDWTISLLEGIESFDVEKGSVESGVDMFSSSN